MLRQVTLGLALCAALSACSGGRTGSSSLPQVTATAASSGPQSITLTIKIPAASSSASTSVSTRRPLYVSSATKSASIAVNSGTPVVVNLTASSPNCSAASGGLVCTATVSAPVGPDTFSETLYSATNTGGSVLSQGRTTTTIVAGKANTVTLTLSGVIASLSLSFTGSAPVSGTKSTVGLAVNFLDAAGESIIGPAAFATPVTLTDTDTSGSTTLSSGTTTGSTLTLNYPADASALSLNYNGSTSFSKAVIAAVAGSIAAANLTLTPQAPSAVTFNDYTTFGYDNQRDVYNPNSTALTTTTLPNIHLAWQANIGNYNTQTQPILATEITGHAGTLFVGGGSGTVYGYDALSGAQMWKYETGQETYTCQQGNTIYFGVGGSAAYDPASKSIYIIGNANSSPNAVASNTLYHLDAATGSLLGSVNFAPAVSGWNSLDFSHTSVTLGTGANAGLAYVGTGATCDKSSWRGRVAVVNIPSMTLNNTFYPDWDPNNTRGNGAQPWGGGGIWGWGGVSIDANGDVLTAVGNTDNGTTNSGSIVAPFVAAPQENSGYGESLVKLSAGLHTVEDSNNPIPTSMISGDSADLDLQGTPLLFQPNGVGCDPMAAVQAKSGTVYLYDTAHIGNGPVKQYQLAPSTYADGFIGGPAYSPATGLLYVNVTSSDESLYHPGMVAINPGCGHPSIAWTTAFGPDSYQPGSDLSPGQPRGVPAVSAGGVILVGTICTPSGNTCGATTSSIATSRNAQSAARGTSSSVRKPLICCAPAGTGGGALWAVDASTGSVLNGGNPLIITPGAIRMPPTIDGNWVFVIDNNGDMYGLTIDPSYPSVDAYQRAVDPRVLKVWEPAPKD
jgi:hypothetical protein